MDITTRAPGPPGDGSTRSGDTSPPEAKSVEDDHYFFRVGTAMPGIFTLTAPRWVRVVK